MNGIKFNELKSDKKIIDFFVDETLLVVYENNLIEVFNLYAIDEKPLFQLNFEKNKDRINRKDNNNNKGNKIILCSLNYIDKKLVIIYDDLHAILEDMSQYLQILAIKN